MKKIRVNVAMAPEEYQSSWDEGICIVIDVLKTSSTIVTLLEEGCSEVVTISNEQESRDLKEKTGMLLSGDRDGVKLPGYDMANSPVQVFENDVRDKGVILHTDSGNRIIDKAAGSRTVLVGCLLNARACAYAALNRALENDCPINILCEGEQSKFVLDDAYCAGCILEEIYSLSITNGICIELSSSARAALKIYGSYATTITAFVNSRSGQKLLESGGHQDILFCTWINVFDSVPVMNKGTMNYFSKVTDLEMAAL